MPFHTPSCPLCSFKGFAPFHAHLFAPLHVKGGALSSGTKETSFGAFRTLYIGARLHRDGNDILIVMALPSPSQLGIEPIWWPCCSHCRWRRSPRNTSIGTNTTHSFPLPLSSQCERTFRGGALSSGGGHKNLVGYVPLLPLYLTRSTSHLVKLLLPGIWQGCSVLQVSYSAAWQEFICNSR